MVEFQTYVHCFFILILASIVIWQCSEQISLYAKEPLKVSLYQNHTNYKHFSAGQLCTVNFLSSDLPPGEPTYILTYALGYLMNSRIFAFPASPGHMLGSRPALYANTKAAYVNLTADPTFNYSKYAFAKSGIKYIHRGSSKGNRRLSVRKPQVLPHFSSVQMGCAVIKRFAAISYSLTSVESISSSQPLLERPSFRFITPAEFPLGGEVKSVPNKLFTLYETPYWQLLSVNEHFLMFDTIPNQDSLYIPRGMVQTTSIKANVDTKKYVHVVNSKKHPCIPVSETSRNPKGFAMRVCEIFCEEEAINSVYGCSGLSILSLPNFQSTLPPCNVYDHLINATGRNPFPKYTEVAEKKRECVVRKECHKQVYCTEWSIKFSDLMVKLVPTPFDVSLLSVGKEEYQKLDLFVNPVMAVVVESKVFSWETMVGNIGGIIGIWVGASVLAFIEWIIQWSIQWSKRKKMKNSIDEDKIEQ